MITCSNKTAVPHILRWRFSRVVPRDPQTKTLWLWSAIETIHFALGIPTSNLISFRSEQRILIWARTPGPGGQKYYTRLLCTMYMYQCASSASSRISRIDRSHRARSWARGVLGARYGARPRQRLDILDMIGPDRDPDTTSGPTEDGNIRKSTESVYGINVRMLRLLASQNTNIVLFILTFAMSTTNADDPSTTTRNTPQKSFKQRRSFGKRILLLNK